MNQFYVFVASDTAPRRLSAPSGFDVAMYRLKRKEWNINSSTRYRRHLIPGDKILIYISGNRDLSKSIFASCVLATSPESIPISKRMTVDAPKNSGILTSEYVVKLSDIIIFKNPVGVREIAPKLSFIKNPKIWGSFLQGGINKISKKDFEIITKLGG